MAWDLCFTLAELHCCGLLGRRGHWQRATVPTHLHAKPVVAAASDNPSIVSGIPTETLVRRHDAAETPAARTRHRACGVRQEAIGGRRGCRGTA
eukprot:scaffold132030_cov27-Tisochrysis_lutea.AAC.2